MKREITQFPLYCLDKGITARYIGNSTYELTCKRSAYTALEIAETYYRTSHRITLERLYTHSQSKYFITFH